MLIISVEIMKTIDEREMQKQQKKKKMERSKGKRGYSERVRAKWFCCAFTLGFLHLTCKASIFNSNLELALSIILKQRELYESRHVAVECRCLKIWDLLISFFNSVLSVPYLVFKTNPLMSISFTSSTNLSYTTFLTTPFFTTSLSLLKSTGTGTNLSISNWSTSAFKLNKSDFAASLDVSIPVAFFKSIFVAY